MNHVPTHVPEGHAAVFQTLATLFSLPPKLQQLEELLDRSEQLLEANEQLGKKLSVWKRKSYVSVRFPERIVRSAALLVYKLDGTIDVVCDHLQHVHDAIQASTTLIDRFGDDVALKDNHIMWKREMKYWRSVAREFAIDVLEVQPGDEFDDDRHAVSETVITDDPDLIDTVQETLSLCFRWRDDQGVEQHRPAKVVLFTGEID